MIGNSFPLCYHQIGFANLFCLHTLCSFCPLTKHIRLATNAGLHYAQSNSVKSAPSRPGQQQYKPLGGCLKAKCVTIRSFDV